MSVRMESGRSEPADSKLEKSCVPTRACAAGVHRGRVERLRIVPRRSAG